MSDYHKPKKPSDKVLHEIDNWFEYNPETGELCRYYKGKDVYYKVGTDIGTAIVVSIFRKNYLVHHIAWYFYYKTWPTKLIDHIDVDYTNNIINNLRESNASKNQSNHKIKRILPTGVHIRKDRKHHIYQSQIAVNGYSKLHLGFYNTPEEAHEAYKIKYKEIHGEDF